MGKPCGQTIHRSGRVAQFSQKAPVGGYTSAMLRIRRPLLLIALLVPFELSALECKSAEVEAERVTALRDVDAGQGVGQGQKSLDRLRALSSPCPVGEAWLLAAIGSNLHILGRNREAIQVYAEAERLIPEVDNDRLLGVVHRGAGVALSSAEAHDDALRHYLIALGASERSDDRIEYAKTASNIGNLYNALNDAETASQYHRQALDAFRALDWKPGIAGSLVNLGAAASKLAAQASEQGSAESTRRHLVELLELNQEALSLFEQLGNDRGIAYAASNIGLAHARLGDAERALQFHRRSLALREQIGDAQGVINSLLYLAGAELQLGRVEASAAHVEHGFRVLPEEHQGLRLELLERRADVERARGDLAAALATMDEYFELYRRIMEEDRRRQVLDLRERYAAEQQGREIELLRQREHISELQLQRQRLIMYVAIVVLALGLIVLAGLVSRMVHARKRAQQLRLAARTDPLTGLPNRRDLIEHIDAAIERNRRTGEPFCLVMADVDFFKSVNDRYGHDVGDSVLVEMAERIHAALRKQDQLARWGGEEFLVLVPDSDLAVGCELAEQLSTVATELAFLAAGEPITLSLSIGVAQFRPGSDREACLKQADQALLAAKRSGRNRIHVAD